MTNRLDKLILVETARITFKERDAPMSNKKAAKQTSRSHKAKTSPSKAPVKEETMETAELEDEDLDLDADEVEDDQETDEEEETSDASNSNNNSSTSSTPKKRGVKKGTKRQPYVICAGIVDNEGTLEVKEVGVTIPAGDGAIDRTKAFTEASAIFEEQFGSKPDKILGVYYQLKGQQKATGRTRKQLSVRVDPNELPALQGERFTAKLDKWQVIAYPTVNPEVHAVMFEKFIGEVPAGKKTPQKPSGMKFVRSAEVQKIS